MTRTLLFVLLMALTTVSAGCDSPSTSPMGRLKRKRPVLENGLTLKQVTLQGVDGLHLEKTPHALTGAEISLSGFLDQGTWGPKHFTTYWKQKEGEFGVSSVAGGPGYAPAILMLLVHGEEDEGEDGVLSVDLVEIRQRTDGEPGWEFRCVMTAPERLGDYVVDLQVAKARIPDEVDNATSEMRLYNYFPIARFPLKVQ